MRTSAMSAWIALFLVPLSASFAADERSQLAAFFEESIGSMHEAVNSCMFDEPSLNEDWALSSFRVAIEPYVTFGVSDVVGISISPRVELIWERESRP